MLQLRLSREVGPAPDSNVVALAPREVGVRRQGQLVAEGVDGAVTADDAVTTTDVLSRLPDLTARQLDYWARQGYVRPDVALPGSGYVRSWPPGEVAVIERMVRLVCIGLPPPVAEKIARLGPGRHRVDQVWIEVA